MTRLKSKLTSPFLLGIQGFVVGALCLWVGPQLASII